MRLIRGSRQQDSLFQRLQEAASRHPIGGAVDCTLFGTGEHFMVTVSDPVTDERLWECAGKATSVCEAFQQWLALQEPK